MNFTTLLPETTSPANETIPPVSNNVSSSKTNILMSGFLKGGSDLITNNSTVGCLEMQQIALIRQLLPH